ncbi:MAG: DUF177 domain-containing protein [Pseudomonadota bacterium]
MEQFAWSVGLADISEDGLSATNLATNDERRAIADALAVTRCDLVSCSYDVKALHGNRFKASGLIRATFEQVCVVTLDPIEQSLEIDLNVEFWPSSQLGSLTEEYDEPDRDDPEPIVDGQLEIGRVVYELLAANIDPYPRSPDAELERSSSNGKGDEPDNPFAVLADLKPATKD